MTKRAMYIRTEYRLALIFLMSSSFAGCQQAGYQAARLPQQLRADSLYPSRGMSLAQLPSSTYRSNTVYPGDVLTVSIASGLELGPVPEWQVRVSDQGYINVPLVGPVRIGGLPLETADETIRKSSIQQQVFRHPQVTVRLVQRESKRVTVIGEVDKPGTYDIPASGGQLAEALAAAGGFTKEAGTKIEVNDSRSRNSEVRHAGMQSQKGVDGTSAKRNNIIDLASGQVTQSTSIEDGAVVLVKKRKLDSASVMGLVNSPKTVDILPENEVRLLDAISLAGGRTLQFADKVTIVRVNPNNGKRIHINASVSEARKDSAANILLAPGDALSVDETPLTFVVGTLQNFVRFGFSTAVPGL